MGLTAAQIGFLNSMNPSAQAAGLGTVLSQAGAIAAPRSIWYVDTNKTGATDSINDYGTSWDKPFKTITYALSQASAWDWIFVGGGDYDEGAVLNVTLEGLKIIGPGIGNQNVAMIYSSSASHHLLYVNAHNVEIAGLGFTQTKDTYDAIRVSQDAARYKCHIHDCRFDGYGQGEYGVKGDGDDGTFDAPDLVIEDCKFQSWQTAAINSNCVRAIIRRNLIVTVAAKVGINHVPNTSDRGGTFIVDNYILGVNSTDTGIKLVGTPDAGMVFIARNYVLGCATTITQAANNAYNSCNNYTSDGAGGALIDTVA